jgi:hypothetical protein
MYASELTFEKPLKMRSWEWGTNLIRGLEFQPAHSFWGRNRIEIDLISTGQ